MIWSGFVEDISKSVNSDQPSSMTLKPYQYSISGFILI